MDQKVEKKDGQRLERKRWQRIEQGGKKWKKGKVAQCCADSAHKC